MRKHLTETERFEIWSFWLNDTNPGSIARRYEIAVQTVYSVVAKMKKRFDIPGHIGPKKSKKIFNLIAKHRVKKPVIVVSQMPLPGAMKPEVNSTVDLQAEWIDGHAHILRLNKKKDIVFCSECGDRWIGER